MSTFFAGITTSVEQADTLYPVKFEWKVFGETKEPYYYELYVGKSEYDLKPYARNIVEKYCYVYDLKAFHGDEIFWQVVGQFGDGTFVKSKLNSFVFGPGSKKIEQFDLPKEVKIVLTWNNPRLDLDLHLTGNIPNINREIHMFKANSEWESRSPWFDYITLDYAHSQFGKGAEVLLLKSSLFNELKQELMLKVTVENYSEKILNTSKALSLSNAKIFIYLDGILSKELDVPVNQEGLFWNAFHLKLSPYDLIIEPLDGLSNNYISIWNNVNTGLIPSPITVPPVEPPSVFATVKAESIDTVIELLPEIGLNIDPETIDLVKITLPRNEVLDVNTLSVFINGNPTNLYIREAKKVKTKTDIVFVVDTTGSMSEEIEGVKTSLKNFIRYLNTVGFDAKVGFLPYDDYAPSSYLALGWQNLSVYDDTLSFIDKIHRLNGGSEIPYTAIDRVFEKANWTNDSERHIVLVTDEDSESGGAYEEIKKRDLIKKLPSNYTVHTILSVAEGEYERFDSDFSASGDPREIAEKTGGVIEYTGSDGVVDLTKSGLLNFAENSYYVFFENPTNSPLDDVEFFFYTDKGLGQGTN